MHNDSLELNGATRDAKLDRPECPAREHTNDVVIAPAIWTRLSEAFPSLASITIAPLSTCCGTHAKHKQ
jgi:hypothetical protein